MENSTKNVNDLLDEAISKYNFNVMIECIDNGARIDHTVLHRVINRDRVDLLDYLLFSPKLKENFPLHYNYDYFGDQPAFLYACTCGSSNTLSYLLNESKIESHFPPLKFKQMTQKALNSACRIGSIKCVDLLLSHEKTKEFCSLNFDEFMVIKTLDDRIIANKPLHPALMEHLVLTQDIEIIKEMKPYVHNLKHVYDTSLAMRNLSDELNKKELINNQINRNKI